jgi:hypothetical protein
MKVHSKFQRYGLAIISCEAVVAAPRPIDAHPVPFSRALNRSHSRAPALGSVKLKVAPRPELGVAHKRPPWDSTIDRLIESPMPVP